MIIILIAKFKFHSTNIIYHRLRVAVFYDETFKRLNGGSTTASQTRIASIFNHVQNFYSRLTVNGQEAAIVPDVVSMTYRAGSYWTADGSIR